jgi:LysM repeat protein
MKAKTLFLSLAFSILTAALIAQERIAEGVSPALFVTHSVAPKETWYSLGRSYGLAPKDLAAFNRLPINTPLEIAQQVRIPLTANNFVQDIKGPGKGLEPVYHVVHEKEWLYRISLNHNKVPIGNLEKWNSITSGQTKPGMKLIVGFLKTSGLTVIRPVAQADEPAPDVTKTNTPVVTRTPEAPVNMIAKGGTGFFKSFYDGNGKSSTGISGVFKSTSGWNDGKYYALMNNVNIGTIVKIDLPPAGKTVYAKVLGELPDMKESAGLALRISDAAASELGAPVGKFNVQVSY